ncbi:MAG: hypothetical protein ACQERS_09310 [Bacteroidota bacterium]
MEQDVYLILVASLLILLPLVASRNAVVPAMAFLVFILLSLPLYFGINRWTGLVFIVVIALLALTAWLAKRKGTIRLL